MDEMLARILSCIGNKHGAQKELAEHLGIHPNVITNWKNGANKSYRGYVNEIADFYGVSPDYLLTGDQKEKAPTLTEKDRRDIARDLEQLMATLENAGDLQFDGDPMSDEARESIKAAMKLGLEAAKVKNKERFTPKKYRKE